MLAAAGLIGAAHAAAPSRHSFNWLDPASWPAIPVPNISVDPTNGVTVGLIPTLLQHDSRGRIVRIVAPDIVHNDEFGWGGHMRILNFPSADRQWSVVAGVMQRVQSKLDAIYETGLLRTRRWSQSTELYYERSGTERFFGIGDETAYAAQSVYTGQTLRLQRRLGWNLTHAWQVAGTLIVQKVRVSAGQLPGIVSITNRFPSVLGIGTTHEVLERVSVTYDTRNDMTVPTHGIDIVVYQAKIEERFTITQLALVEDITSGSGQTNFVTIDLDIANGMLMAPIPQHARILQRYPALRQPMTAVPIGELA